MVGASSDPTEPIDIRYDNSNARLEIDWADGVTSVFRYEFLRWECPCAHCAGEMGIPGQLQFVTELAPERYVLSGIQVVGHYAVRPTWSDGHDTGIYAFARLRRISDRARDDLKSDRPAGTKEPVKGPA